MGLSTYTELFQYGRAHNIAIGAFNSCNMETVQAIVSAACKVDSPLIVQLYHEHVDYAGADYIQAICSVAAKNATVKIALGLDHGSSYEQAEHCIRSGFSGVMIDLSSEDYDYNVMQSKKVVALAHANGVSVEAEIGKIVNADSNLEEIAAGYTDPKIARKFAIETGIDCLAVSIGTAHGMYKFTPKINYDLLKTLIEEVPCPIVVHGGSNTPDEDILKMVKMGAAKLNIGTDFFNAYYKAFQDTIAENGENMDTIKAMSAARSAVEKVAMEKIKLLTAYRK